jgi:hypothetical protein
MKQDLELYDLCKKVKEKTGWDESVQIIRKYSMSETPTELLRPPEGMELSILSGTLEWEAPLYTSDYILQKLEEKHYTLRVEHNHSDMYWYAYFAGREQRSLFDEDEDWNLGGETPIKALLRLVLSMDDLDDRFSFTGLGVPKRTTYAKFTKPNNGYDSQQEQAKVLVLGAAYEVEHVSMGQSSTSIRLKNVKGAFNSVMFDFYDHHMKSIDIYNMPEFNGYMI